MVQVKKFMTIPKFSKEIGLPEQRVRELCHSNKGHRFAQRKGENGYFYIDTDEFLKMWKSGQLGE